MLRSRWALTALLLVVGLVPLGLLAYLSTSSAAKAMKDRVEESMQASAAMSALYINEELRGLAEVDESFANRPFLVQALADGDSTRYDHRQIRQTLLELRGVRRGIGTAFIADSSGRLLDIVPATPTIVGKDFSFRDWYKGVTARGTVYVSEAYRSQAAGRQFVVAVAAPIWSDSRPKQRLGIIVAAYTVSAIQGFAKRFEEARGVAVTVTDQRGVVIADPHMHGNGLVSRAGDREVVAALRGESGVVQDHEAGEDIVAAYAPIPNLGWTVTATIPNETAFAAIGRLRWAVALASLLLASFIVMKSWFLGRVLGQRQRAQDLMRAVLDSTRDGIAFLEPDGRIGFTNSVLERMAAEFLRIDTGSTTLQAAAGDVAERTRDPEAFRAGTARMANEPEYAGVDEYEMLSGEAIRRYTAPVRDSNGSILGRISVLSDVTAEHDAERLKSELMATVSHELRTPLASILGFSELLITRELDPGTRARYLETVHQEAERLTALINDFLDLQRIEEGGLTLALEPFDVGELLEQEVDLFAGQSSSHSLELDLPDDPLVVMAERDRIAQVLANFLSNAIKYSPEGGVVKVLGEADGSAVRVSVADSGLGIPRDQQRNIFTKFFRVDSSDTRRIGGTGLGLALCREIVETHGGRIGFDSAEGLGSTFWFELPSGRSSADGRPRLLVIEDDRDAAELLERYLTKDGYTVEFAATGEEGLERIQNGSPPALILLDVRLGGAVDGWEVLARLKDAAHTAGIPVLVCTAYGGRENAAVLGAADFLAKPFTARQLRETVARLLPAGGRSVLVVDDEEPVRRLVVETLVGYGLELREAADGEEALEAIAERVPDAIVLDLVMPRVDGFAVLEQLQASPETRSIPVVVLTARRLSAEERLVLRSRALALLEKSEYSARELRTLVVQALGTQA